MDETLEAFVELGLQGATVFDSVGMGQILSRDIPIFAGLQLLLPSSKLGNKTIITLVKDNQIKKIVTEIERICGAKMSDPGTGIVFTLAVDQTYGLAENNLE